jgi:hypothetical protein
MPLRAAPFSSSTVSHFKGERRHAPVGFLGGLLGVGLQNPLATAIGRTGGTGELWRSGCWRTCRSTRRREHERYLCEI